MALFMGSAQSREAVIDVIASLLVGCLGLLAVAAGAGKAHLVAALTAAITMNGPALFAALQQFGAWAIGTAAAHPVVFLLCALAALLAVSLYKSRGAQLTEIQVRTSYITQVVRDYKAGVVGLGAMLKEVGLQVGFLGINLLWTSIVNTFYTLLNAAAGVMDLLLEAVSAVVKSVEESANDVLHIRTA